MTHYVDIHVGKRLRNRRLEIGMRQVQLAEKIGVTFQQVQKYERGFNRISCSKLVQIAVALEVHPTYFFEGLPASKERTNQVRRDILETSETQELVRVYYALPVPDVRKKFLALLRSIGKRSE